MPIGVYDVRVVDYGYWRGSPQGSVRAAESRLFRRPAKRQRWKYARLAPRAIRMALRISISDDKFPAGGKTYIENYPAINEARSEIELAVRS